MADKVAESVNDGVTSISNLAREAAGGSDSLDPQIQAREGIFYDGDLSIAISMVVFFILAGVAVIWTRRYPDRRRNPDREFVVFLLDPRNQDRGNHTGQAGVGDGRGQADENNQQNQV